jgi:hypothetical protein
MTEEWRSIPGWEGLYEVSSLGRVRSVERVILRSNGAPQTVRARIRQLVTDSSGYPCVSLYRNGVQIQRRVSIFVALAFVGAADGVCRHLDDDKNNNTAANIAWGSQADNMNDAVANGKHFWANRTSCKHGHPYTPDNTRIDKRGGRVCRTCARARVQTYYARKAAA